MKKLFVLFVLAFLCSETYAQSRIALPLTGWRYPNGNRIFHAVGDSVLSGTDTLTVGILGKGGLMPIAVAITYQVTDADVSATADSFAVTYQAGVGGIYTTVGSANAVEVVPGTPYTKTLVMNTTGAAAAHNAQASVFPQCDAIRLLLADGSLATVDSMAYKIRVLGIYEQGPSALYALPLRNWRYGNGKTYQHTVGDSLSDATQDSLTIGFGDVSPVSVAVAFEFKGVGGTRDSVQVTYQIGNQGLFAIQDTLQNEAGASITTTGVTRMRAIVFNTNGAALAFATQGLNATHGQALRLFLKQATDDNETISYRVRAFGVFRKQ